MEPVQSQSLTVSLSVDVDLDYDSFSGKTPREVAESIEAELCDLTFEISPKIGANISDVVLVPISVTLTRDLSLTRDIFNTAISKPASK